MEGSLSKWTNVMKGWQFRWFVLDDTAGLFSYYTSKEKMYKGVRRGCVRLRGAVIGIDDEDEATFTITVDGKTFHFQAQDSEERERWIRALEDTVLRHTQVRRSGGAAAMALNRKRAGVAGSLGGIEEFDKKLAETDGYLELLLAQVAKLPSKSSSTSSSSEASSSASSSASEYEQIAAKARDMSESIKHAIVLLQIAKNATQPEDQAEAKNFKSSSSSLAAPTAAILAKTGEETDATKEPAKVAVETAVECREDQKAAALAPAPPSLSVTAAAAGTAASPGTSAKGSTSSTLRPDKSGIPEISYSSSDDDDFFDAEEEDEDDDEEDEEGEKMVPAVGVNQHAGKASVEERAKSPVAPPVSVAAAPAEPDKDGDGNVIRELHPLSESSIDYDALYDEESSEEGLDDVDMKSHGSVITHLLSQVRIGMDLTKIVLPTFILERRSLLEMYSDFFAHPDLFVGIPDGKTPEDRMVRVLRWYLSSFHAGRKSSIAKKPYNPILGETFRCHWDHEREAAGAGASSNSSNNNNMCNDGPLPWCKDNQLTFVAEQVSHHPPISAFYAEHPEKRISVNAHIYTKSSFLGMSIAVHNIGQGKLTLMDHDEEYICTFPSGYGRSILTVPWIELGGKIQITCPKTNYLANIEFKCKQFFSSDVNKITAEVLAPNNKKPLLKVEGEWNGRMMAKWPATGKNEVFVDVNQLPIHPKQCKRIADQGLFESRRLWKDVTHGLKVGNIEAATAGKSALEQRQREEAAERKERNNAWETRLFRPIGENWQFMNPLEKRLLDKRRK